MKSRNCNKWESMSEDNLINWITVDSRLKILWSGLMFCGTVCWPSSIKTTIWHSNCKNKLKCIALEKESIGNLKINWDKNSIISTRSCKKYKNIMLHSQINLIWSKDRTMTSNFNCMSLHGKDNTIKAKANYTTAQFRITILQSIFCIIKRNFCKRSLKGSCQLFSKNLCPLLWPKFMLLMKK